MFPADLRSAREQFLRTIAIIVSAFFWVTLAAVFVAGLFVSVATIIAPIYCAFIAAFVLMAHAIWLAYVRGNAVRLGPTQLPHLWHKVIAASKRFGLSEPPTTYLMQSGGVLNAFATKLLGRRFVILHSELVDACELGAATEGSSEIDFVIGHEVAHIAAGHLSYLLLPVRLVPLLGPAYARACEYTCDRAAHAFAGSLEISSRALAILAAGRRAGRMVDLDAFVEQRMEAGRFWLAVYELNSGHPYLPKRIAALREAEAPGAAPQIGRNVAAYPLAPMFAGAVGGAAAAPLVFICVVAMMAAVALPAAQKYAARARAAQLTPIEPEPTVAAPAPAAATADEPGVVRGERFDWKVRLPGPRWEVMPTEHARKQNRLADRWLTRPDLDAHVLIIGEHIGGQAITIDQLMRSVLANAQKSAKKFRVVNQGTIGRGGRLVEARSTVNGLPLTQFFSVFIAGDNAYQVYGFAPESSHAKVKNELLTAIASFEPLGN
jgi:Zn-dependent protease with chaperone function